MKLKYLGTAAAEAFPALFCECDNCKKARAAGGRNIRSRSQAIVDNRLLLDFPGDTCWHAAQNRIDLLQTNHCLITHTHTDHFDPADLSYTRLPFSYHPQDWTFTLWGSEDLIPLLRDYPRTGDSPLRLRTVRPFEPFELDGYTVTALKAEHGTDHPCFYMISDGEKTILYAHDTDFFPEETWEYLARVKPVFDLVSLDCTEGAFDSLPYKGHMCLGTNIACRDRMKAEGFLRDDTILVLNHFSHNALQGVYEEFVPIARRHGFLVSYDGMEITL